MNDDEQPAGETPLDPNEIEGLIPAHLTTRSELDRWEHDNIVDALEWLEKRRARDILEESFLRELHRRMFEQVWNWAGKFRLNEKNLGVSFHQIPVQLRQLMDDTRYWIKHRSYPPDELAVRFHHRLVVIHPFPNGNGRHARLMTDLLLENMLGRQAFSWGKRSLDQSGEARRDYISALQAADGLDFKPLLKFVRS